jgi:hypothetical protein
MCTSIVCGFILNPHVPTTGSIALTYYGLIAVHFLLIPGLLICLFCVAGRESRWLFILIVFVGAVVAVFLSAFAFNPMCRNIPFWEALCVESVLEKIVAKDEGSPLLLTAHVIGSFFTYLFIMRSRNKV